LITTVLLPFAVQFKHSFQKHEHAVCKAQNIVHFDTHKIDCSFFHFNNEKKIVTAEAQTASAKFHYKSSRAPPFLLI